MITWQGIFFLLLRRPRVRVIVWLFLGMIGIYSGMLFQSCRLFCDAVIASAWKNTCLKELTTIKTNYRGLAVPNNMLQHRT